MKYHPILIRGVVSILNEVFFDDRYADQSIEFHFKNNRKWGRRDRSFVAETVYDCVRWWSQYWTLLHLKPKPNSLEKLIEVSLWARGKPFFSSSFLENSEHWKGQFNFRYQKLKPEEKASIPSWLYKMGEEELGAQVWESLLKMLNKPNNVVLRINTMAGSVEEVQKLLAEEGIITKKLSHVSTGLVLPERKNVFATKAFKNGLFEVQDGSSQMVAPFLSPKSGEFIIDACSGAGGKTLHLSTLMKGKGRVLALDIHSWKLEALKKRSKRQRLQNIEIRAIESKKVIKRLQGKADGLLLDVPCSGVGVLRRNPDSKWKLSPERIKELRQIQIEILTNYSSMVKPGGRLVYSTCSIFPSENEQIVDQFLQIHPHWKKVAQKTVHPAEDGFDGFFMARLVRD